MQEHVASSVATDQGTPARLDLYVRDAATMAEAERLLSGRTRDVRLKGDLARAFRDRSWRQSAKIIRSWMIWVMVLDLLTMTLNLVLLPPGPGIAMVAPGIIIPLAATFVTLVWRKRRSDLLLGVTLTVGMAVILLSTSLMGAMAGGEWHERYLNVMVFMAIAGITIFSVPMWQTLAIAITALGLYLVFQLYNPSIATLSALSGVFFLACGVGATVVARRTMNILAQKAFLLELRDRRRLAELAEANESLDRLSKTDPLTGVANRRWMTEQLAQLWRDAEGIDGSVAMLMCDVDDFKNLNDRLGHAEGDRCLVEIAGIISSRIRRDVDYVARYGGEEFLVLLTDADEAVALATAERIRKGIADAGLANPGARTAPIVTLSIGVAICSPGTGTPTPTELQSRADAALYRAKHHGRNRIELDREAAAGGGEPPLSAATNSLRS